MSVGELRGAVEGGPCTPTLDRPAELNAVTDAIHPGWTEPPFAP